jgi:hypothetical protein
MTMNKSQLCFPLAPVKLDLPSEALAPFILAIYAQPWTLNGIRAEARRLGCERTHCRPHNVLLRYIAETRRAALAWE